MNSSTYLLASDTDNYGTGSPLLQTRGGISTGLCKSNLNYHRRFFINFEILIDSERYLMYRMNTQEAPKDLQSSSAIWFS